jgi:hypothetical protein
MSKFYNAKKNIYLQRFNAKPEFGNNYTYVGFEVLPAVVIRSSIFWDITPCSPLKVNDVSEEHVASILGLKGKPSKKPAQSRKQSEL